MENSIFDEDEYLGISNELWSKLMVSSSERTLDLNEKISEKKMVLKTHLSYVQVLTMCKKLYDAR